MTEQEFMTQVWRPYDRITTAEGVPGKVIGVAFNTKSVRAFISGAPEWVKCELIETHTAAKGGPCDEGKIIEELHNKVLKQADEIEKLREERKYLTDKVSRSQIEALLRAVNLMEQGLREKKHKLDQIDSGLKQIQDALMKMESDGEIVGK